MHLRFEHGTDRDLAIGKEAPADTDAAHEQALPLVGGIALTDDQLRTAATDIHHQSSVVPGRQAMGHAQVDQSCLLASGDDFDGMVERPLGTLDEGVIGVDLAHGIGADSTDILRRQGAESLGEAFQTGQGPLSHLGEQTFVLGQTLSKPYRLTQTIDDLQMAVFDLHYNEMEAVGAQVDGGDGFFCFGFSRIQI